MTDIKPLDAALSEAAQVIERQYPAEARRKKSFSKYTLRDSGNESDGDLEELSFQTMNGLFCQMKYSGEILEANDRMRVLRENCTATPSKKGERGPNFFDYVPKGDKLDLYKAMKGLPQGEERVLSVPLKVSNFKVFVEAEVVAEEGSVTLRISDQELATIQETELNRIKGSIAKRPNMGVWIVDDHGIIRDVLDNNCELNLGWSGEDVRGMNILTFIEPRHRDKVKEFATQSRKDAVYRIDRISKGGKRVSTEVVMGRITLHDGIEYTMYLDTYIAS